MKRGVGQTYERCVATVLLHGGKAPSTKTMRSSNAAYTSTRPRIVTLLSPNVIYSV